MGAAARMLRYARRAAGLSQRELAEKVGVSQPSIARIESGAVTPRVDTLDKLLRGCGYQLELDRLKGEGVDREHVRGFLSLAPEARMESGRNWARLGSG